MDPLPSTFTQWGNFGFVGVLTGFFVWFVWHLVSKTIPDMMIAAKEEREGMRTDFLRELKETREGSNEEIKEEIKEIGTQMHKRFDTVEYKIDRRGSEPIHQKGS